jgi:hypothetical protein
VPSRVKILMIELVPAPVTEKLAVLNNLTRAVWPTTFCIVVSMSGENTGCRTARKPIFMAGYGKLTARKQHGVASTSEIWRSAMHWGAEEIRKRSRLIAT